MQKVTLTWAKDFQFICEDDDGHSLLIDTGKDAGGGGAAFKPINLLLVALGGCLAMDIVGILKKKRVDLRGITVEVEGERAAEHPKRFTRMKVVIKPRGEIPEPDLRQAFELSRDKYCSIYATLIHPPEIEYVLEPASK